MKSDVVQLNVTAAPTGGPAAASAPPNAGPKPSIARDKATFSYVKANAPRGAEKPLRFLADVVSNVDDIFHSGLREVSRAGQWLQNSFIARVLGWLPANTGNVLTKVADSKTISMAQRVTQSPMFMSFAGFMSKASPIVGLIMAPFDIKNCVNLWKDPKALLPHKILTTVRTVTGTAMCLGGFLGLVVLPWLGMPGAAAACISIALKVGLVNLVASAPYWAKGIGGALGWVGSKVGGFLKQAVGD